jgi:hypothetical protein
VSAQYSVPAHVAVPHVAPPNIDPDDPDDPDDDEVVVEEHAATTRAKVASVTTVLGVEERSIMDGTLPEAVQLVTDRVKGIRSDVE